MKADADLLAGGYICQPKPVAAHHCTFPGADIRRHSQAGHLDGLSSGCKLAVQARKYPGQLVGFSHVMDRHLVRQPRSRVSEFMLISSIRAGASAPPGKRLNSRWAPIQ